jgi:RNA-directed DNA polymerase
MLGTREKSLLNLSPEKHYITFQIPKPGTNEKRTIETPGDILKPLLGKLADSLQQLYAEHKTPAAFGYVRSYSHDPDKRNIYTNAKKHLGCKYLVNMDFDNFFYQVSIDKLKNLFNDFSLFDFLPETEEFLTRMVTYRGRLPMGSATSPPLSNFATMALDNELLLWCNFQGIAYSRYVDDLSFSANSPISSNQLEKINDILTSHRFVIDEKKTKIYGKDDVKIITGLIVDKKISIPHDFITDFEKSLLKLADMHSFARQYPDKNVFDWLERMQQNMQGRLAFIGFIYGNRNPIFVKLKKQLESVNMTGYDEECISWRYAGYELH